MRKLVKFIAIIFYGKLNIFHLQRENPLVQYIRGWK